jgi:protein tyrosine phosphatase (PTP) superfamily phosphohydrolase (DUF442 family)
MQKIRKYKFWIIPLFLLIVLFFLFYGRKTLAPQHNLESTLLPQQAANESVTPTATIQAPTISFVGPRGNVPQGAPADYGFWSFAVPVTGVLSRSGQPTLKDFQWLKTNGWKSDIDLRIDGDHNEVSDDAKIPGFNDLGFNYLKIQMVDGAAPTDAQAEQFLSFVTKPENQPAHVHCRGGIGRAGIMVVLYRYAVQGWPLDQAIAESRLFQGGIDAGQEKWITAWAKSHPAGSYKN